MSRPRVRILCLGNQLLADDGAGPAVAALLRSEGRVPGCEIMESSAAGLGWIDDIVGVDRLILVDAIVTGRAAPGTVHILHEDDLGKGYGTNPHTMSLGAAVALARQLGLDAPSEVLVLAIEAADVETFGAPMSEAVRRGVQEIARMCEEFARRP